MIQINWNKIPKTIGRFTRTETHAACVTYSLTSELNDNFVITQFYIDFEDNEVSPIYREYLFGKDEVLNFTFDEILEISKLLEECKEELDDGLSKY